MKWIRTQEQSLPSFQNSVVTIGNFDGLHLGHQNLIKTLVEISNAKHAPSVVCTFKPHPRTVLQPDQPTLRLFDYRDQAEILEAQGVDFLIEEKFTKGFSLMTGEEFLELYLIHHFRPVHIVIGYDFSFGKNRSGDRKFLETYCEMHKIGLTVVPALDMRGQIVSSSVIRKLLEHGDVVKAAEYLGRRYYMRGPVRVGFKRGRTIGVPTANISPEIDFTPRKGVYFTVVHWKNKKYPSITNIGLNPTFANTDAYLKVETHIFDFDQDIYGDQIKVEMYTFHRDEMKFPNIESLKSQIEKDIVAAKKYFGELHEDL